MTKQLVVIGAGMASGRLLEHLFETSPDWNVTLFNAEPRGNYNRLMLSPVLSGEKEYKDIITHDAAWYSNHGVTCRFGERVLEIDRDAHQVIGENGPVNYDKLVIATGSSPFIIPVPGSDLPGVLTYRDLDDTNAMIETAAKGGRAVVIGGGLLGLEAAAGLKARGMDVTVLHLMGHVMERQLDETAGDLLRADMERRGIRILCRAATAKISGDQRVEAVELEDGTLLPADLVVMAVGIRPETTLARAAGLQIERGIVVSSAMQTSDQDIFALGECVEFDGQLFGLVAPLYDQAQILAQVLNGKPATYVPADTATKLKVTGCDVFSAGDFADADDREDIVMKDPVHNTYRRLILCNDHLIGAVFYGDTADSAWFHSLIRDRSDIAGLRDSLIFGPAFKGGPPVDPMVAVAALPGDTQTHGCNGENFGNHGFGPDWLGHGVGGFFKCRTDHTIRKAA